MLVLYTAQSCFTAGEVISTALELLPGRAEQVKMSYISKRQLACNNVCHVFVIIMVLMGNCLSLFTKFLRHYSYCHMLSSFHLGMLTVSEAAKIK